MEWSLGWDVVGRLAVATILDGRLVVDITVAARTDALLDAHLSTVARSPIVADLRRR